MGPRLDTKPALCVEMIHTFIFSGINPESMSPLTLGGKSLESCIETRDTSTFVGLWHLYLRRRQSPPLGVLSTGETLAHLAAYNDQIDILRFLAASGSALEDTSLGRSPMHWAVQGNSFRAVAFLLRAGCNPDIVDPSGFTPATYAVMNGNLPILHILVSLSKHSDASIFSSELPQGRVPTPPPQLSADPLVLDRDGHSLVQWAAYKGHPAVIRYLVTVCGVDVNAVDNEGSTALHWAAREGHTEACVTLLELGADLAARATDGATAESVARSRRHRDTAGVLRRVAAGGGLWRGRHPLHSLPEGSAATLTAHPPDCGGVTCPHGLYPIVASNVFGSVACWALEKAASLSPLKGWSSLAVLGRSDVAMRRALVSAVVIAVFVGFVPTLSPFRIFVYGCVLAVLGAVFGVVLKMCSARPLRAVMRSTNRSKPPSISDGGSVVDNAGGAASRGSRGHRPQPPVVEDESALPHSHPSGVYDSLLGLLGTWVEELTSPTPPPDMVTDRTVAELYWVRRTNHAVSFFAAFTMLLSALWHYFAVTSSGALIVTSSSLIGWWGHLCFTAMPILCIGIVVGGALTLLVTPGLRAPAPSNPDEWASSRLLSHFIECAKAMPPVTPSLPGVSLKRGEVCSGCGSVALSNLQQHDVFTGRCVSSFICLDSILDVVVGHGNAFFYFVYSSSLSLASMAVCFIVGSHVYHSGTLGPFGASLTMPSEGSPVAAAQVTSSRWCGMDSLYSLTSIPAVVLGWLPFFWQSTVTFRLALGVCVPLLTLARVAAFGLFAGLGRFTSGGLRDSVAQRAMARKFLPNLVRSLLRQPLDVPGDRSESAVSEDQKRGRWQANAFGPSSTKCSHGHSQGSGGHSHSHG